MTTHNGVITTVSGEIDKYLEPGWKHELADVLGVSESSLSRWLETDKKNWSFYQLMQIRQFFRSKGVIIHLEDLYRQIYREIEHLEQFKEYVPLTYLDQAKLVGVSHGRYKDTKFRDIGEIQRFKQLVKDSTLFPIKMKYY